MWNIRLSVQEADAEIVLQRAKEKFPPAQPRVISDQGSQLSRVIQGVQLAEGSTLIFYRLDAGAGVIEIKHFWHGARGTPRL
jgi:hypothetical protein